MFFLLQHFLLMLRTTEVKPLTLFETEGLDEVIIDKVYITL